MTVQDLLLFHDFLTLLTEDIHASRTEFFHPFFQLSQMGFFFPFLLHILEQLQIVFGRFLQIFKLQQALCGRCHGFIFFPAAVQLLQTLLQLLLALTHTFFTDKGAPGIVLRIQAAQLEVLVQQAVCGHADFTLAQFCNILAFDYISQ